MKKFIFNIPIKFFYCLFVGFLSQYLGVAIGIAQSDINGLLGVPEPIVRQSSNFPIDEIRPSVFHIAVETGENNFEHGTAFLLHPSGILMTCNHVLRSGDHGIINNRLGQSTSFHILARIPQSDVVLLKANLRENLTALKFKDSRLFNENDSLWTVFNFYDETLATLRGTIVARNRIRSPSCEYYGMILDFLVSPGASGAPVFCRDGDVIGIICGSHHAIPRALAIPVEQIIDDCQAVCNLNTMYGKKTGIEIELTDGRLLVTGTLSESPAGRVGIETDDEIKKIGDWEINNFQDYWLSLIAWEYEHPGQEIPISLLKKKDNTFVTVHVQPIGCQLSGLSVVPDDIKPGCILKTRNNLTGVISEEWLESLDSVKNPTNGEFEITGYIKIPEAGSYAFHLNFPGEGELRIGEEGDDSLNGKKTLFQSSAWRAYFNQGVFPFRIAGKPTQTISEPILLMETPDSLPKPVPHVWFFCPAKTDGKVSAGD